jgi:rhamnosyl/mannosyltransferase
LCSNPKYAKGSDLLQCYKNKVQVLWYGIDPEPYFNPSRRAQLEAKCLRAQLELPLWLVVGRLVYYKGISVALDALARLPGHLLVIGAGALLIHVGHYFDLKYMRWIFGPDYFITKKKHEPNEQRPG